MGDKTYTVVSPLMGTFYRSSDPEAPPLVEEGQAVAAGEVVCIIESMKIFTEIKTEKAGTIKAILLENEDMVMKDQGVIEIELS